MTLLALRFPVAVAVLALALGAVGCGPKQKFCPQTSNGVCPEPMDASGESIYVKDAAEEERGSIYVPSDAAGG